MIIEKPQPPLGEAGDEGYEFFFSACTKPIDKQKRFATRASEPRNSRMAVIRPCRCIVAGFLLPSVYRQWESGHNNARGCPVAVSSSRHPRPRSLRLACVDARTEADMGGVAGTGVHKQQACREVRP